MSDKEKNEANVLEFRLKNINNEIEHIDLIVQQLVTKYGGKPIDYLAVATQISMIQAMADASTPE